MSEPVKEIEASVIRKRKIRRRKIIWVVCSVLVVGILAFVIISRSGKKPSDANMITAEVSRADISQIIKATGSVTAQTGASIKIGSQITGRIKSIHTDVGKQVNANQIVAELDLPDINAQLDQARANLASARIREQQEESGVGLQLTSTSSDITKAKAALSSAKASYNEAVQNVKLEISNAQAAVTQAEASARNAQSTLTRQKQLLAKGYVAAQDIDNAQTQADVAAAQLDSAKQNLELVRAKTATDLETARNTVANAQAALAASNAGTATNTIKYQNVAAAKSAVRQAAAQVAIAQAQFSKTIIRTPISGTVVVLDAQQGETIAAGLSAPTLIQVVDLNRLQVDAFVDETDIGNVHVGQQATISVDAFPDKKFTGHVVRVAGAATIQTNVVTYDTTIAVDNPGGLLKPDMTATASIEVARHENVIAVPSEAIKSTKRGQVVYVVQPTGDPKPLRVKTGVSDDTMTEITEGLDEGQTIVLAGYPPTTTGLPGGNQRGGTRSPLSPMGGGGGRGR